MIELVKKTFSRSLIYSVGNLFSKLVGFILLPIFTTKLSVSEFGAFGLLESTQQIIIGIFGLGINYAFERWFWEKGLENKRKSMFFSITLFTIFVSTIIITIFHLFSIQIASTLFDSKEYVAALRIMSFVLGTELIFSNISSYLRLKDKVKLFTLSVILKFTFNLLFTSILLLIYDQAVDGIFRGRLFGNLAFIIIVFPFIWKNTVMKIEYKILKEMISYRLPLAISSISLMLLSFTDRYLLKFMVSLENTGYYSFGFKIANTLKILIISSAWMAIQPMIFKIMNHEKNKRYYSKLMTYFILIVTSFGVIFCLFSPELIKLVSLNTVNYWETFQLIPLIIFSILLGTVKDISTIGLNIQKNTKPIAFHTFTTAVINILLGIVLIPIWNYMGAGLATLISQFLLLVFIYRSAQKSYFIPYEIKKIALLLILAAIIVSLSLLTNSIQLLYRTPIKLFLLSIFPISLIKLNFFDKIEKEKLFKLFKTWNKPKEIIKIFKSAL